MILHILHLSPTTIHIFISEMKKEAEDILSKCAGHSLGALQVY